MRPLEHHDDIGDLPLVRHQTCPGLVGPGSEFDDARGVGAVAVRRRRFIFGRYQLEDFQGWRATATLIVHTAGYTRVSGRSG